MAICVDYSLASKYTRHGGVEIDEKGNALEPKSKLTQWERDFEKKHGREPQGERVPEELLPKRVKLIKGKKLYDYNGYMPSGGGVTVSRRLKDAIEDIEPGVHQFVPVEVFHKDGSAYGEPFWIFRICTCIDAINPVLGGVEKTFYTAYPEEEPDDYIWEIISGGKDYLAVHKELITGRAAWTDRRYAPRKFFSDALVDRMISEGMEGWDTTAVWQEL